MRRGWPSRAAIPHASDAGTCRVVRHMSFDPIEDRSTPPSPPTPEAWWTNAKCLDSDSLQQHFLDVKDVCFRGIPGRPRMDRAQPRWQSGQMSLECWCTRQQPLRCRTPRAARPCRTLGGTPPSLQRKRGSRAPTCLPVCSALQRAVHQPSRKDQIDRSQISDSP